MKRYIRSDTRYRLIKKIVDGFKSAGCTEVSVLYRDNSHCKLSLVLPNGSKTSITVWYDYEKMEDGTKGINQYQSWKSYYQVNSDGVVFDDSGNFVGEAVVKLSDQKLITKYKKYFNPESIRTDSGDVVIDHPEKAKCYQDVVKSLETRNIIHRS